MILSARKRNAIKADRKFLLALNGLLEEPGRLATFSKPRQYYVEVMARAMTWWLDGAHKDFSAEPPGPENYAPRDRILLLFLDTHTGEDRTAALEAREAQAARPASQ